MPKAIREKIIVLEDENDKPEIIQLMKQSEAASTSGKVLSVGSMVTEVKEGDRVAFSKFAGFPLPWGRQRHRILKQDDVLMVMNEDEKAPVTVNFHTDNISKSVIVQ